MEREKLNQLPKINNDEFYGFTQRRSSEDGNLLISSDVSNTLGYLNEYLEKNDFVIKNKDETKDREKDLYKCFKAIGDKINNEFKKDKIDCETYDKLERNLEEISLKLDY